MRQLFVTLSPLVALAAISLPQIFSDGMVLQDHASYDQRPFVYGYADFGELVVVNRTLPGKAPEPYLATADKSVHT